MLKKTILLVEDNQQLNEVNQKMLETQGYDVVIATDVAEAREQIFTVRPDLIVLDIILPGGSGFEFCEEIKQRINIPILVLSALGTNSDIVRGLAVGADDYLPKPFDYEVLFARINALLRRAEHAFSKKVVQLGPYSFDYDALRVTKDGTDMVLGPKEFAIFSLLAEKANSFVSSEELYTQVWGQEAKGDLNTLYPHISRLRKKIELDQLMKIEQKRGVGYCLNVEDKLLRQ